MTLKQVFIIPILIAVLLSIQAYAADKLTKLTFYKNPGAMIFFVSFEYDATEKNISRTVYDWGNYLIRRTAIIENGGKPVQQNYHSGNGDLQNFATYNYAGDQKTVSIFNEFSQLLFQSSYAMTSASNSYSLSSGERIDYEMAGSKISKIQVYDLGGNVTHYANVEYNGPSAIFNAGLTNPSRISSIHMLSPEKVAITFTLTKDTQVSAKIFNLQGRLITSTIKPASKKGEYRIVLDMSDKGFSPKNGVFLLEVTMGNNKESFKMRSLK
ncbi:MAG: T9SS type A sorting domain-containing protein [Fibrobacteria bacterium]|nr:T9SS type A sorting domain-containing protein [Fibrobacteria bacterium]